MDLAHPERRGLVQEGGQLAHLRRHRVSKRMALHDLGADRRVVVLEECRGHFPHCTVIAQVHAPLAPRLHGQRSASRPRHQWVAVLLPLSRADDRQRLHRAPSDGRVGVACSSIRLSRCLVGVACPAGAHAGRRIAGRGQRSRRLGPPASDAARVPCPPTDGLKVRLSALDGVEVLPDEDGVGRPACTLGHCATPVALLGAVDGLWQRRDLRGPGLAGVLLASQQCARTRLGAMRAQDSVVDEGDAAACLVRDRVGKSAPAHRAVGSLGQRHDLRGPRRAGASLASWTSGRATRRTGSARKQARAGKGVPQLA
jgi:hypothetical protein